MVIHRILGNGVADVTPFTPNCKLMPIPLDSLIDAGGTVVGGLLNSIFGSNSNKRTNETNMEIARMNNEQQYKMFQEQNEFNLDMWNKQNEYNDPSAQVQRLLAAGINPVAVFGNGSVSEASQLTSAQAPQLQQARVNPYQPDFKVGEAVNAFMQSQLINAQKKKLEADAAHTETVNEFDTKSMVSRLQSLQSMAKRDDYVGQLAKTQLEYEQAALYWKVLSQKYDVTLQRDQMRMNTEKLYAAQLQNKLYEIQVAYQPKMNEAQLKQYYTAVNQMIAQIGLIQANTTLTKAQVNTEIQKACSEFYRAAGIQADAEMKNGIKDAVIGLQNYEYQDYNKNWWNRTVQGYLGLGSQAANGASAAVLTKYLLAP